MAGAAPRLRAAGARMVARALLPASAGRESGCTHLFAQATPPIWTGKLSLRDRFVQPVFTLRERLVCLYGTIFQIIRQEAIRAKPNRLRFRRQRKQGEVLPSAAKSPRTVFTI